MLPAPVNEEDAAESAGEDGLSIQGLEGGEPKAGSIIIVDEWAKAARGELPSAAERAELVERPPAEWMEPSEDALVCRRGPRPPPLEKTFGGGSSGRSSSSSMAGEGRRAEAEGEGAACVDRPPAGEEEPEDAVERTSNVVAARRGGGGRSTPLPSGRLCCCCGSGGAGGRLAGGPPLAVGVGLARSSGDACSALACKVALDRVVGGWGRGLEAVSKLGRGCSAPGRDGRGPGADAGGRARGEQTCEPRSRSDTWALQVEHCSERVEAVRQSSASWSDGVKLVWPAMDQPQARKARKERDSEGEGGGDRPQLKGGLVTPALPNRWLAVPRGPACPTVSRAGP